jgi:hypothetical protein
MSATSIAARLLERDRTQYVAAVAIAVVMGAVLTVEPVIALLPVAVLVGALLLVDGRARVVFVVFGGIAVFQQGDELTPLKAMFLMGFLVASAGAVMHLEGLMSTQAYRLLRPLLAASVAVGVLLVVSGGVAYAHGTPLASLWLRDIAPYALFAAAPVFALDAWSAFSYRALVRLLVAAGLLGAVAFAVTWLQRRGIADFALARIGLATHFLPAGLFAYAMSLALDAKRLRWLAVAGFTLALLLATGTRSSLALLAAPLAIAFGARRAIAQRSIRLFVFVPITILLTLAAVAAVLHFSDADQADVSRRIEAFRTSGTGMDNSYIERLRQTSVAWDTFKDDIVFGAGPGTIFQWVTVDRRLISSYLLDTPATFPAKFGLVGLLVLAFVLVKYVSFIRMVGRERVNDGTYFMLVGYAAIAVASTLFYSPLEDKGFAFTLILIVALALHHRPREPQYGERWSHSGAPIASVGRS